MTSWITRIWSRMEGGTGPLIQAPRSHSISLLSFCCSQIQPHNSISRSREGNQYQKMLCSFAVANSAGCRAKLVCPLFQTALFSGSRDRMLPLLAFQVPTSKVVLMTFYLLGAAPQGESLNKHSCHSRFAMSFRCLKSDFYACLFIQVILRKRRRKSRPERAPPMMATATNIFARRNSLAFGAPPAAFILGVPPPSAQWCGVETEGQTVMGTLPLPPPPICSWL